jgi:predicted amidohydrolase
MKVCIVQPPYSLDYNKSDEYFKYEIDYMDKCDESMDIIVFPENSDIPCIAKTREEADASVAKYNKLLLDKASYTAKRCKSLLFINARFKSEKGYINTTYAFDRQGNVAGMYFKQHPVQSEIDKIKLDGDYSFEHTEPTVIEIEGIRFGFLTCYDFYFYENYANLARYNLDVIVGCSHQRTDTHSALEIITRFLAYNTNTYVLRSSVSMDENSSVGGASMVIAPDGEVLLNMESRVGMETVDIDVTRKYYKPAGFGNPLSAHYEYIEKGRRPWKYRPAGSAIVNPDHIMAYPRVCAHRGFNTIAPENSMPAFGAAVAMGAEEIEFDLWYTKDGEVVSVHDPFLERVSDGCGNVYDYTYAELLNFDFGFKHGEKFKGMKILRFEEILKKFSCHVIMNIHINLKALKIIQIFL